jgi:hypothetical protein
VLPEAMRTMPSLLTLAVGLSFGVMGIFLLAGRETQEDETLGRPPPAI